MPEHARCFTIAFGLALLGASSGCGQVVTINPFVDALPPSDTVYTASSQRLAEIGPGESAPRDRGWHDMHLEAEDDRVQHWALWWEDAFEDSGSEDNAFAVTWEDGLAFLWCPGRFALNTVAWPISAVVDWPWAVRCSDGRISAQTFGLRSHDASACE